MCSYKKWLYGVITFDDEDRENSSICCMGKNNFLRENGSFTGPDGGFGFSMKCKKCLYDK